MRETDGVGASFRRQAAAWALSQVQSPCVCAEADVSSHDEVHLEAT